MKNPKFEHLNRIAQILEENEMRNLAILQNEERILAQQFVIKEKPKWSFPRLSNY